MTHDHWIVVAMSAGWSGLVGLVGLAVVWLLRRRSLTWAVAVIALVAVGGFVTSTLATARAMFLTGHDFGVVLISSVVAGAVSLGFALGVAAAVVRRARALQRQARSLSATGASAPVDSGPAELREISAELDRTSRRLAEAHAREQQLDASRRELVAWVSHDLRTPLAGLTAMAEALEDGMATDPHRYHQQMRTEIQRLSRMVDDLFELSRIHAGALQLTIERVAVDEVISDALAGAQPVASAKGVHLHGSGEVGLLVDADPRELTRAVSNLVMNAIRHTPADGRVEVTGRRRGDRVEVDVVDACGGIPPEQLTRVFAPGWRGTTARTPDTAAGAGLGLAIVRGIAEAHSGTIDVGNHDGGCRFWLTLPAG